MTKGLLFSTLLHALIVVFAWVGVPFMRRDIQIETPIVVELVEIAEVTERDCDETDDVASNQ